MDDDHDGLRRVLDERVLGAFAQSIRIPTLANVCSFKLNLALVAASQADDLKVEGSNLLTDTFY